MPSQAIYQNDATDLISGEALKASALKFLAEMRIKVDQEQGGLLGVFDSWFARVLWQLSSFDRARPWEESAQEAAAHGRVQSAAGVSGLE